MYKIISKQVIATDIKRIQVTAEIISRKAKPGQFVMVVPDGKSSKIPLAIVETDPKRGLITLIFEEAGDTTKALGALQIGDPVFAILGPLGVPAEMKDSGVIAFVAHGVAIANILWICRAYRQAGHKIIGLISAKTKRSLILESQMRLACHKLYVATEDGTYEKRGGITGILPDVLKRENANTVFAAGPLTTLDEISRMTEAKKTKIFVGLQPMMVDGIGLCGSCRVKVDGKEILACVEGPWFDARKVDFQNLKMRMGL